MNLSNHVPLLVGRLFRLEVEFLPPQAFEDDRGLGIQHIEFSLEYSFVRRSLNIHVWLDMAPWLSGMAPQAARTHVMGPT